jgi:hypothetical protein
MKGFTEMEKRKRGKGKQKDQMKSCLEAGDK